MASQSGIEAAHEVLHGDPALLTKPIKDIKDKWELVPAFLQVP